jgi:phosphopantothenoylcysteine decarboxylase / phosphopantothenate---cysteine ligase
MSILTGKTIVLGVSGGIAAYKTAELVRLLVTGGANVKVMMTRNATEFISPLTLQTLSSNPVATDTFSLTQESEIGHIRLADSADAIVIAPATADVIAKASVGIADDILTTVLLATRAKVAFAPAMNVHMYEHPTVAENLARLRSRRVTIIEPAEGALACGYEGMGRLPDPAIILAETQEPIDPVRFVSNRSSGKMGFAIARAAWRRGASVKLVAGPASLATPHGIDRIDTVSAAELLDATSSNFPWCTTLVMAAAVADFRPANPARGKIKKDARGLQLAMDPIADEMPRLAAKKGSRLMIGFAAETDQLEANARGKLKRKGLDLIVANDVTEPGAGFAVDTNIVTLIGADGDAHRHPQMSKDAVADLILDRIVALRQSLAPRGAKAKSSTKSVRLRSVR